MKTWLKVVLILLLILVIVFGGFYFFFASKGEPTVASLNLQSATVARGNINVEVHGTGMLNVDVSQDVYARTAGRVISVLKDDGDSVSEGELIAIMENDDLEEQERTLRDDLYLKELDLSAKRAGRSVSSIRASVEGRVKQLNAQKGDDMNTVQKQYGALCVLSTDGRMRIELPAPAGISALTVPQTVKVQIDTKTIDGTLMSADAKTLTVLIQDDSYTPGAVAKVNDKDGNALGEGTLIINRPVMVTGVSGQIRSVDVKENDKVDAQEKLFTLEDGAISVDTEKAMLERDDLQHQLDDVREKLARLEIRSPLTGIIANITLREGATVAEGTQAALVIQTDRAKVELEVDELDVAKVYPGQPASIKIDAIAGKRYQTQVERVLPVGTREDDITSYDVLLYLDNQDNMLPYMSLSGDITVASVENTLMIPVAALQTINDQQYVMLMPTDADMVGYYSKQRSGPAERMRRMMGTADGTDLEVLQGIAPQLMRRVEIGLIAKEYAQVVSGLNEGDQIVVPKSGGGMMEMMRSMQGGGMQ